MLLLVSGATLHPRSERVGHLIVPKAWGLPNSINPQPGRWAMDNGAFSGFDAGAFVQNSMLKQSLIGQDAHVAGRFRALNVGDRSSIDFS